MHSYVRSTLAGVKDYKNLDPLKIREKGVFSQNLFIIIIFIIILIFSS